MLAAEPKSDSRMDGLQQEQLLTNESLKLMAQKAGVNELSPELAVVFQQYVERKVRDYICAALISGK